MATSKPLPDKDKPDLKAVDGREDRDAPPWERHNLGYAMGEAKADKDIKARITPGMHRAIQRIVQQRKVPQIETQSDVLRLGIFWVLWWVGHKATDDSVLQDMLDVQMWEGEVLYRKTTHQRISDLLRSIEEQLAITKAEGRDVEHRAILEELRKNTNKIPDEKLKAEATKLWLKYKR